MAEPAADGLDGDARVDEFGGVGVPELVDVNVDFGLLAVLGPGVVGGVAGQVPTGPFLQLMLGRNSAPNW